MQRTSGSATTYENGKPVNHFTRVPNELIDHQGLTAEEKLILIKYALHAFGDKVKVNPSQLEIAKRLRKSRNTVKTATAALASLGLLEPAGEGHQGKQETYTVHLDRVNAVPQGRLKKPNLLKLEQVTCSNGAYVEPQTCSNGAYKPYQDNTLPNTHDESEATSAIGAFVESREAPSNGSSGLVSQDKGLAQMVPMFTKKQINELYLAPDGKRVTDDLDDLDYELNSLVLPELFSQPIPRRKLEELSAMRGVRFCAMWAAWLSRKMASMTMKGEQVENAAGLYITNVERGWTVDPAWPPFVACADLGRARAAYEWRRAHELGHTASDELEETTNVELDDLVPF